MEVPWTEGPAPAGGEAEQSAKPSAAGGVEVPQPWGNIVLFVVVATYQLYGLRVDVQPLVGFCLPIVHGMVGCLEFVGKPNRE